MSRFCIFKSDMHQRFFSNHPLNEDRKPLHQHNLTAIPLQGADIVFMEYTMNDMIAVSQQQQGDAGCDLDIPSRRATERLLRSLLSFENKPAVVVIHSWVRTPFRPCTLSKAISAAPLNRSAAPRTTFIYWCISFLCTSHMRR